MADMFACAGTGVDVTGAPEEIRILPLGMVKSQKGDFLVDDESVRLIIGRFKARRIDLVIDYEHQTLADVQAPAGGWVKDIRKGEDALVAKVEWTAKAAEYLKNREYRYLSPVVFVRKKDGKACVLHSAALTNTPAIDGMFPIVNSMGADIEMDMGAGPEGGTMELKEWAELFGLPGTATEEEVKKAASDSVAAAKQLKELEKTKSGGGPAANNTILSLLGLKEDARTEEVAAQIQALKAGGDARQEVLELKEKLQKMEAGETVKKALKEGRITAAQKDWAMEYALKDPEGFAKFTQLAPQAVPMGQMELEDAPAGQAGQEAMSVKVLKNLGLTSEDIEKYANKEEI